MGNTRVVDSEFIARCKQLLAKGLSLASIATEMGVSSATLYTLKKAAWNEDVYRMLVKANKQSFESKTGKALKPLPDVLTSFTHMTLFSRTDYVVMTDGVVLKCKNGNVISLIDNKGVLNTREV